jgi:hypothetical protein
MIVFAVLMVLVSIFVLILGNISDRQKKAQKASAA